MHVSGVIEVLLSKHDLCSRIQSKNKSEAGLLLTEKTSQIAKKTPRTEPRVLEEMPLCLP